MLTVLFIARTAIAYQFESIAAGSFSLTEGTELGFAQLGLLIGCHMLPGIVLALPGGLLAQRFGSKPIVLIGLGLMIIGALTMVTVAVPMLFAGRIISGAGGVLLNVVLTRMVTDWFAGRDAVLAFSIFVASWPLGIALGLVTLPATGIVYGWSGIAIVSALPSLLALVLVYVFYRDPLQLVDIRSAATVGLRVRDYALATSAGAVWGLYNVSLVIFVSAAPDLFLANGYTLANAGFITSVLGWVLVVVLPAGGWIAQRVARPVAFTVASLMFVAGAAVAMALGPQTIVALVILAVIFGLPAGLLLALPGELLSAESRAGGMGMFYLSFYVSMTALPAVAGLIRNATHTVAGPVLFGACMALLAALGMLLLAPHRQTGAV
ncbi:MFS transporter [Methylobacterium sp. J-001]|jgi:cyanate permease|uniref:MFS transporter n=1 Tax=Methylobacterium sp. J-001 TaxID=2836609 RepID=UPI001FB9495F|nr:MFS transporter [Methylobacterium sp. J-001]MCJ2115059.1 MFS transporter [Methylobacterium sp. J-001]